MFVESNDYEETSIPRHEAVIFDISCFLHQMDCFVLMDKYTIMMLTVR